jgi:hypothetical protein
VQKPAVELILRYIYNALFAIKILSYYEHTIATSFEHGLSPYCKDLLLESNLSFIACPRRSLSIFSCISCSSSAIPSKTTTSPSLSVSEALSSSWAGVQVMMGIE